MIRALYTAASGMSAQQANLDTVANNLANSSTTGFRQLRLQFQDMIYQNMVTPGAAQSQSTVSAGLQIGLGAKPAATEVINTQGELNETDNPLDVAIQGAGFFQVQRPDGTIAYTRAGQFHLNNQGTIVTTDGDPLIPTITIPSNPFNDTSVLYPNGILNSTNNSELYGAKLQFDYDYDFANLTALVGYRSVTAFNIFVQPPVPAAGAPPSR